MLKGNCVHVGVSSSGLSAMKVDQARAIPSRSTINCDHAFASVKGGTAWTQLFKKAIASAPMVCDNCPSTEARSLMISRA